MGDDIPIAIDFDSLPKMLNLINYDIFDEQIYLNTSIYIDLFNNFFNY